MPNYLNLSEGTVGDVTVAQTLLLSTDSVIVADRGYYDFSLLLGWNQQGCRFVVRIRDNMKYSVVKNDPIKVENILSDQIILPVGKSGSEKYHGNLRRVKVWDEKNKTVIILLTKEIGQQERFPGFIRPVGK